VEKKLRKDAEADELAREYHAFNQVLRESDKTRKLYTWMKKNHPDWPAVPKLLLAMLPEQLDQQAYDWLYREMDLDAQMKTMLAEYETEREKLETDKDVDDTDRKELLDTLKRYYSFRLTDFYQVALGAGQHEHTEKLSRKILAFNDSADVLNVLAWSGYLTEKPVKVNLEQARKAYEMTEGKDASIVDTYVRLLYEFDQKDKAATILDKALESVEEGQGKAMLMHCKQSLGLAARG